MKRDDLFEIIEPPSGGLAGLQAKLDGSRSPWGMRLAATVGVATLVAAGLVSPFGPYRLTLGEPPAPVARAPIAHPALEPPPADAVSVLPQARAHTAVQLAHQDEQVIYYVVATVP